VKLVEFLYLGHTLWPLALLASRDGHTHQLKSLKHLLKLQEEATSLFSAFFLMPPNSITVRLTLPLLCGKFQQPMQQKPKSCEKPLRNAPHNLPHCWQ
jgi:hypothetical protein